MAALMTGDAVLLASRAFLVVAPRAPGALARGHLPAFAALCAPSSVKKLTETRPIADSAMASLMEGRRQGAGD